MTLANTAKEMVGPTGARLELDLEPDVVVPAAWEHALPRILREAVANAIEHGRPRTVSVHLRDVDGIWLRVTDDGDGFDPSEPRSESSFGLIGMREQTESLGGEFKLSSEPGHGTSIEILLDPSKSIGFGRIASALRLASESRSGTACAEGGGGTSSAT